MLARRTKLLFTQFGIVALLLSGCASSGSGSLTSSIAASENGDAANDSIPSDSTSSESQTKAEDDSALISAYLTEIATYSSRETELLDRYASVTGDAFTDDVTTYNELLDLVPDVNAFVADVEAIEPGSPELVRVHNIYIEGWNEQFQGMTLALQAIGDQDYATMSEANQHFANGRAKIREYIAELESLQNR